MPMYIRTGINNNTKIQNHKHENIQLKTTAPPAGKPAHKMKER